MYRRDLVIKLTFHSTRRLSWGAGEVFYGLETEITGKALSLSIIDNSLTMTKAIEAPILISRDFYWTLDRYLLAIEKGVFTQEDKIELIYGKIVEIMPAGSSHEYCITLLAKFFRRRFGEEYQLREEKSLVLVNQKSLPEPGLVVVFDRNYSNRKPSSEEVFLIAEVANSSLKLDRTIKVELYAEANLAEYWIVNLVNRQIEVHLKPDPEQKRYGSVTHYHEDETFTSPFAGEVVVSELLPDVEEEEA